MRKIVFALIVLLTYFSYLYSFIEEMTNEYLRIIGYPESGRFLIKTTGGDPNLDTDQDALLLYEDVSPTSFTTIRIDERDFKFGDTEVGYFISRIKKRGDRMVTVWSVRNIEITQTLRFVNGTTTHRPDTVEISYAIWNKDTREHNIGVRILLDIYLKDSDSAKFKIPGGEIITSEKEFVGEQIPQYWYSFDNFNNPKIKVQGTLLIEGAPAPDRLIFASWGILAKKLWDFNVKPGRTFRRSAGLGEPDSAVAVYWNPHKYNPNDTYTVKTYYGLYGGALYKGKIFNVSLSGPVVTSGGTFTVKVDIQNISPYNAKDVNAEIFLPNGLKLIRGEMKKKTVGSLYSKEIKKTSFNIFPDGTVKGIMSYKVKVSGVVNGKLESVEVERKINYKPTKKVASEKFRYTLYDFTAINKLIDSMNTLLKENSLHIDELNKLIKTMGSYSKTQATNDRIAIMNRVEQTKNNENKLPDAIKSVEKVKEGEKKR